MASPYERIECVQGDLTRERVDAIVNAAAPHLRGGGGVDGAIHRAAGPGLLRECIERHPGGCPTGEARITGGHDLAARFVIHTVGPVYRDGRSGEAELLAACHRNSVALAAQHDVSTLSFPAISTGAFGYPWAEAAEVSLSSLGAALAEHAGVAQVRLVLFGDELHGLFSATLARLSETSP
jgi:O-acetyl-ADP-ribose deacetylase (regulator of RNase III)